MAGIPIVGSAYGPFWEGFRLAPANQHPESRKSPAGQHNQKNTINLADIFTEAVPTLRSCQIIAVFQSSDTRLFESFSQNDPVTGLVRNFDTELIRNQGRIDAVEQAGQLVHENAIDAEPWTETQSMSPYPFLLKIIAAVVCFGVGTNPSSYERLTEPEFMHLPPLPCVDRANSRLNVRNRRREMRSPRSPLMS